MAINPFFNANYYLANNADLVAAGLHTPEQLWEHYTTFGAQERADLLEVNTNIAPSLRQANDWFDVGYYLATNADLVAAGITAGQALNHYYEYGINEGRAFNPDPALQPSEFDAETYAEENPDVREHYGIEEGAELTAADKANLLKHYLAFGIYEGREGAGEDFSDAIQEASFNTIFVPAGKSEVGTLANDKFVVVDGYEYKDWYIDGAGGKNEVVFESDAGVGEMITFTTPAEDPEDDPIISEEIFGPFNLTLRNIQSVEVDKGVDVTATVNGLLDSLTLTNAGNVDLTFSGVNGTADALNVDVVKSGELTVNGLETVNLAFDEDFVAGDADEFVLNANKSQGATQTINLSGGDKVALTFDNKGSAKLTDLTIDGSNLENGLGEVKIDGQAQNITNVTVKGSVDAANDFNIAVGEDQLLTVIGGNKADTFNATEVIETFTGGRGNDTFKFAATNAAAAKVEDGKIVGVDTITDFKKGDKVEDVEFKGFVELATGTGSLSLEELLLEKDEAEAPILGTGAAFNFGGDAYLVVAEAELDDDELGSVSLIKLAGVDASKLDVDAGAIVLA